MKLTALELRRFGHFEDAVVEFGDGTGVHVLHGPNEAGKSTTLDALRYTLYGMPHGNSKEPKYDFRHRPATIRTAVRLALDDGSTLQFARNRSTKVSVLEFDGDGPDAAAADRLAGALAGVPRELWDAKHGLNQASLRSGAAALLANGSTGEALFAAASGMLGATRVLDGLRTARRALLSDAGGSGELHVAVKALKDATSDLDRARRATAGYDDAVADHARLSTQVEALRVREGSLVAECARLERAVAAGAQLAQRARLVDSCAALDDLPARWGVEEHERLRAATATLATANGDGARLTTRIEQLEGQRDALAVEDALLAASDRVDALHRGLGEVATCTAELPELRVTARRVADELAAALDDLGTASDADVATLLPATSARDGLLDALGRLEALDATVAAAEIELDAALLRLDAARAAIPASAAGPVGLAAITAALATAARIDEEAIARGQSRLETTRRGLEQRAARLPGCQLDLIGACTVPLPAATARGQLELQFDALAARQTEVRARRDNAGVKLVQHHEAFAELAAGGAVPDPEQLAVLRGERDDAWQRVRAAALAQTTVGEATPVLAGYECVLAITDDYADTLAADGQRVGAADALRRQAADDERRIEGATAELAELAEREFALHQAWADLWRPSGVTPGPVEAMRELAAEVEAIRADHTRMEAEGDELAGRHARRDAASSDLAAALGMVPGDAVPTLAALVERATATRQAIEESSHAAATARGTLEERTRDHAERAAQLEHARRARAAHEQAWLAALAAIGLPGTTGAAATRSHLATIESLAARHAADVVARRAVAAHESRVSDFVADVRAVVEALGEAAADVAGAEPNLAVTLLRTRIDEARADGRLHADLGRQLVESRAGLDEARAARAGAEATLDALVDHAGLADPAALEAADARWREHDALRRRIEVIDGELVVATRMGIEELATLLDGHDEAALHVELAALRDASGELELERVGLAARRDAAAKALGAIEGSGEQADAAIRMRDSRARVEQLVPEYRLLALQERLLSSMLDEQARTDRGPIVDRAGGYVERLTCGAWRRIIIGIDDSGEPQVQLERASTGDAVALDGLSEGTLDQLYLALRLATLVEGAARGETMPLIVDDVLPSFDDERATATMSLLGEVSEHMQVIFLTHHERLVELATNAIEPDRLHLHRLERFGRALVA